MQQPPPKEPKRRWYQRLFAWCRHHPIAAAAILGVFLGLSVLATMISAQTPTSTPTVQATQVQATDTPTPVTGLCNPSCSTDTSPVATEKPTIVPVRPRALPTRQGANPVCDEKVTNTPCVQFASVQDAAVGESYVDAVVHTSVNNGTVLVEDDITNSKDAQGKPETSLDAIQLSCFNIQQGLWYGLESTINSDGSQTFRKSAFREVDITFTDQQKGGSFASCNLTSAGVDKIDKAGMWDDGDFVGAWALYDSVSIQ